MVVLVNIVPESFIKACAENEILQVVFFAMVFAAALTRLKNERYKEIMIEFCDALCSLTFKATEIIMLFSPLGIGAAIAVAIAYAF